MLPLLAALAAPLWHSLIFASPFLLQPLSLQSTEADLTSSLVICICWLHTQDMSCLWLQKGAVLRGCCGAGFATGRGWQLCPGNQAGRAQTLGQQWATFLWGI